MFIFCMLFTRYRSHIQDKRTVHLSNCKLSLKSQMTYWAKVLLIAACPSAQHPKSLIPSAEENDNHFEACRKLVECTVLSHQKSSVYVDFELAGPRKIHLPETHLHKSILPGSDLPSAIARRQDCCLGRLSGCPALPTPPTRSKRQRSAVRLSVAVSTKVHVHCTELFMACPLTKMTWHGLPGNGNVSTLWEYWSR